MQNDVEPTLSEKIKEEKIYMPEQLPENNKPDDRPVKSALHGKLRTEFYKNFYVCVPTNHYQEGCICEFTDEEIEPVIEWFADFLATELERQRQEYVAAVEKLEARGEQRYLSESGFWCKRVTIAKEDVLAILAKKERE